MESGIHCRRTETELSLTLLGQHDAVAGVAFPYFGGIENPHFRRVKHNPVLVRQLPVKKPDISRWQHLSGRQRL